MTMALATPLLAGGPPGWVVYGALGLLTIGGIYMMSQAGDKADGGLRDEPTTDTCVGNCSPPGDPCKGLRSQLQKHEDKLREYTNNPEGSDNLGLLGGPYDAQIIAGRIKSLQRQIESFRKLVAKCEAENARS